MGAKTTPILSERNARQIFEKQTKKSTESTEYSGVYRIFYQSRPHPKQKPEITTKSPIRFQNSPFFFRPSNPPVFSSSSASPGSVNLKAAPIHPTGAGRFANQLSGFCHRVVMWCVYVCNHDLYTTPSSRLFETWFFSTICMNIVEILVYAYIYILAYYIDGLKPFALLSPLGKCMYIFHLPQHFRSFWREIQNELV